MSLLDITPILIQYADIATLKALRLTCKAISDLIPIQYIKAIKDICPDFALDYLLSIDLIRGYTNARALEDIGAKELGALVYARLTIDKDYNDGDIIERVINDCLTGETPYLDSLLRVLRGRHYYSIITYACVNDRPDIIIAWLKAECDRTAPGNALERLHSELFHGTRVRRNPSIHQRHPEFPIQLAYKNGNVATVDLIMSLFPGNYEDDVILDEGYVFPANAIRSRRFREDLILLRDDNPLVYGANNRDIFCHVLRHFNGGEFKKMNNRRGVDTALINAVSKGNTAAIGWYLDAGYYVTPHEFATMVVKRYADKETLIDILTHNAALLKYGPRSHTHKVHLEILRRNASSNFSKMMPNAIGKKRYNLRQYIEVRELMSWFDALVYDVDI